MNLNQVAIYSTDVFASVEFYQKLGLKLIVDSAPRYVRFELPEGDATLSVSYRDKISPESNIVLYFECENLDARVEELKQIGIEFESEPQDQTWLWRESYLKDPNDNRICLFYAGENRQNPPWRVKS
jgi:catechol 2,3-dioxygenase-like lactoylglutathione lyase family enzyme